LAMQLSQFNEQSATYSQRRLNLVVVDVVSNVLENLIDIGSSVVVDGNSGTLGPDLRLGRSHCAEAGNLLATERGSGVRAGDVAGSEGSSPERSRGGGRSESGGRGV